MRPAHSTFGRHRKLVHGQRAYIRKRSISGEGNVVPGTRIRDVLRNEIFLDEEEISRMKKRNVTGVCYQRKIMHSMDNVE